MNSLSCIFSQTDFPFSMLPCSQVWLQKDIWTEWIIHIRIKKLINTVVKIIKMRQVVPCNCTQLCHALYSLSVLHIMQHDHSGDKAKHLSHQPSHLKAYKRKALKIEQLSWLYLYSFQVRLEAQKSNAALCCCWCYT